MYISLPRFAHRSSSQLLSHQLLYQPARQIRSQVQTLAKASSKKTQLPTEADVIVIGGGAIGCSTLYHLQSLGVNAILLEKDKITAGTTWHSAGLVWRLRPSEADILLINRTRELVQTNGILEQETGQTCGWNSNGGLFIASTKERLDEYKRLLTIGKYFGIESHVLSPSETKDLYPLMNTADLYGTLYSPGDGTVEPAEFVTTLSKACKKRGAKIFEDVAVDQFLTDNRAITGVVTSTGEMIKTKKVVLCGGVWSRDIAAKLGVKVPLCAMKHAYVLTDSIPGIRTMPCVRDHDLSLYLRVQGECLQVGGYEQNPVFWDQVEHDFAFSLFDLDWDVFSAHLESGTQRVPIIADTGIKSEVCGPESFTSDHKPLLGPVPEVKGFYLGCGFNSSGIMLSGGCGQQLAHWVVDGQPQFDIFSYDINRIHASMSDNTDWINQRSHESYAKNYSIVFPMDEPLAGRCMRKSHIHEILLQQGCVFQERHGFERPAWFSAANSKENIHAQPLQYDYYGEYGYNKHENYEYRNKLGDEYTFDFAVNHACIGEEVKACRERVAIFDQSYFGKFFLKGEQAVDALQYICSNVVNKPVNSTTYTEMCNDNGTVECDLAVSRIAEDEYYITAGGLSCSHDWQHIQAIIDEKQFNCKLTNESDSYGMFSLMGPMSRTVLGKLTDADLSNQAFPFATNQLITIEGADGKKHQVRAIRLTFVGELGWELHTPRESCVPVYRGLIDAGAEFDIRPAGYRAIDSLSCEKGYLHWHEDVGLSDTPLEAGVAFVVNPKLKTDVEFRGRDALVKQSQNGLLKRLVFVRLSNKELRLHGLETIWRRDDDDWHCVGFLRRASFDYTENESIGTGYIHNHNKGAVIDATYIRGNKKLNIEAPRYQIEVMGERYPCEITLKAKFDPKSERVQGIYGSEFTVEKEK